VQQQEQDKKGFGPHGPLQGDSIFTEDGVMSADRFLEIFNALTPELMEAEHIGQDISLSVIAPGNPYTWAWVVEKLIGGAIAGVGGRILDGIIGDQGVKPSLTIDQVFEAIRSALHAEALRQAHVQLEDAQNIYQRYLRGGERFRLEAAELSVGSVITQLGGLGLGANRGYIIAVTLFVLILQDLEKISGVDQGQNVVDCLRNGRAKLEHWNAQWEEGTKGRFVAFACTVEPRTRMRDFDSYTCRYKKDRRWKVFCYESRSAPTQEQKNRWNNEYLADLQRELDSVYEAHITPNNEVIQRWNQIPSIADRLRDWPDDIRGPFFR